MLSLGDAPNGLRADFYTNKTLAGSQLRWGIPESSCMVPKAAWVGVRTHAAPQRHIQHRWLMVELVDFISVICPVCSVFLSFPH